jgi:hypothetical protein
MQNLLEIAREDGQPELVSYFFLNWLATAGQYSGHDDLADAIRRDIWPNPFLYYDSVVCSSSVSVHQELLCFAQSQAPLLHVRAQLHRAVNALLHRADAVYWSRVSHAQPEDMEVELEYTDGEGLEFQEEEDEEHVGNEEGVQYELAGSEDEEDQDVGVADEEEEEEEEGEEDVEVDEEEEDDEPAEDGDGEGEELEEEEDGDDGDAL